MTTAAVLIASTRAATGVYTDTTGPVIQRWCVDRGFATAATVVAVDGDPFAAALTAALADHPDLIITSGGTGISPTDRTAAITEAALDYLIPGIAEEIRRQGVAKVPTAILSRGVAGVAGRTLVVNLPGSTGGVKDGLAVLGSVVGHALDQLAGGDHSRIPAGTAAD